MIMNIKFLIIRTVEGAHTTERVLEFIMCAILKKL